MAKSKSTRDRDEAETTGAEAPVEVEVVEVIAPLAKPKRGRAKASGASTGASAAKKPAAEAKARPARGARAGAGARSEAAGDDELDGEPRDDGDEDTDGRDRDRDRDDDEEGEVVEVVGEVVEGGRDAAPLDDDGGEPVVDEDAPRGEVYPGDAFSFDDGDAAPVDRGVRGAPRPRVSTRKKSADDDENDSSAAALSRTDPLQAYLREVQRHPLLTAEEERNLTEHYAKTGDVATAAKLVTSNLRLVVKLAYEYRRAYKNVMDLIQEGNIGLMQAVKRYDPTRGVKLSSYAAWWIRAYVLRFILNNWRLVKLGTTQAQRKLFFNLNKEKNRLTSMGIEPTSAEIAKRLSVDEKEVIAMDRRLSSGEASLDAPIGDAEGRSVSRLEMMPSSTIAPDAAFEAHELGQLVQERLATFRETLKGKDIEIFDKRMSADEPLTLQELGDQFGISRERVRQLEARLAGRLRTYLKEELGDAVG